MDANRFDAVSKLFAARRLSRREAMVKGGAALAATGLAAAGLARAAAQDATPAADATPSADARADSTQPELLFVQSFQSGNIVPEAGADGRYTVTLEQGLGQTIFFSDRPDRIVGAMPTERFLGFLGFTPDNPPNAALVLQQASGETDVAVVELFDPVYDAAGPGVTYNVQVLEEWETALNMGFQEAPNDLAALAPDFGAAHLFIDGVHDCPSVPIQCWYPDANSQDKRGRKAGDLPDSIAHCAIGNGACYPCGEHAYERSYWVDLCNQTFAACNGACNTWNFCSRDSLFYDTLCRGQVDGS